MAKQLLFLTVGHKVLHSNPAEGKFQLMTSFIFNLFIYSILRGVKTHLVHWLFYHLARYKTYIYKL